METGDNTLSLDFKDFSLKKCLSFIEGSKANKMLCFGKSISLKPFRVALGRFSSKIMFSEDMTYNCKGHSYESIICIESNLSDEIMVSLFELIEDSLSEGGTFFLIYENSLNTTALKQFKQQLVKQGFEYESSCLDDAQKNQNISSDSTGCIVTVKKPFADEMFQIVRQYENGNLEKYEYIRQMHHISRGLFSLAKRLPKTDLKKIEILDNDLIFTTRADNLKFHFSGVDRRAAPFEILNFGVYEAGEQELLRRLTKNARVIFDLGANIGWYTIWFAKNMSNSNVYAFEPIPETFGYLQKNVSENALKNVCVYNLALGERKCEVDFFYFPQGSIVASQHNLLNCKKSKLVKVQMEPLDGFVEKIGLTSVDFVKCDVEGGELSTMKGSTGLLSKMQPVIYTELYPGWCSKYGYHANDVVSLLASYGYKCFFPYNNRLLEIRDLENQKDPEKMNYFFLNTCKHAEEIRSLCVGKFEELVPTN